MRGSQDQPACNADTQRSTPACAGKPHRPALVVAISGVYPRVCGEAIEALEAPLDMPGLPPRVRGSHSEYQKQGEYAGSTPACAGKPLLNWSVSTTTWVYPRVCGEARFSLGVQIPDHGLPPRVRGSQPRVNLLIMNVRSTPACAGKPLG